MMILSAEIYYDYFLFTIYSLIICVSFLIVYSKRYIETIIFVSVFSMLLVVAYSLLDAPDVAMTEAAVNAALSGIVMLLAVIKLQDTKPVIIEKQELGWLVLIIMLIILIYIISLFGDVLHENYQRYSRHYIDNTSRDIGVKNMVTAILAGYRGFDTLCETAVIFIAALSSYVIIKENR